MALISFGGADSIEINNDLRATLQKILDALAEDEKQLDFLLNGNLDANNIQANSITSDEIQAGSITTDKIQAGAVTTDLIADGAVDTSTIADAAIIATKIAAGAVIAAKIAAGAVTADKISVSQLSAIASDIGTVVAGSIYGAYIATGNGTFPRVELSAVNRLLTAFSDASNYVSISPQTGGASPGIAWTESGGTGAYMQYVAGFGILFSTFLTGRTIKFSPSGNIDFSPNGDITVGGLTTTTGTVYVSATSGGPNNVPINFSKGLRTI